MEQTEMSLMSGVGTQSLQPGTKYSNPGDWINRRGDPQPRASIRRIIVLKADHIGDFLIASDACLLLRHFFPDAHIDLICGPWNVGLARRLGVFDAVYGVKFFDEVSGRQADPRVARETQASGMAHLKEMRLKPYDLAIDLRYDRDTRRILLDIDAHFYAGWGNPYEFPFLDLAMPMIYEGFHQYDHAYEKVLTGQSFRSTGSCDPVSSGLAEAPGPITAIKSTIEQTVTVASEPFVLGPGRYDGVLQLYVSKRVSSTTGLQLILQAVDIDVILMKQRSDIEVLETGIYDIKFSFAVDMPRERLFLTVALENANEFDGVLLEFLKLRCIERYKLNVPSSHMEHRASLLVLRVAQMFLQGPLFGTNRVRDLLTTADKMIPGDSKLELMRARDRILAWQSNGDCVIGFSLSCNSAIRKWPLSYFIEVAKYLLSIDGVRLVLIGGPEDRAEAAFACQCLQLREETHSLCGLAPLEDLGVILEPLDLFIGSNTGTTHFAGKVGVRTLGIYAGTNHPREWGPIGPNASWIYRDELCAPCYLTDLKDCRHGHVCMLSLLPSDVIHLVGSEVGSILARRQGREGT
jgi:ADP-heptose:LPS heptosyltransferase